jgi:hypothetical protein
MSQMAVEASKSAFLGMHCRRETGSRRHCEANFLVLGIIAVVPQWNGSSHVVEASRIVIMSEVGIGGAL